MSVRTELLALGLRQSGWTFQAIGNRLGVTRAHARSLALAGERRVEQPELFALSTRARRVIERSGLKAPFSEVQVATWIQANEPIYRFRHLGRKTARELYAFAGLPFPGWCGGVNVARCPHCGKALP